LVFPLWREGEDSKMGERKRWEEVKKVRRECGGRASEREKELYL
jgi:hypothetical protein